MKSEAHFSKKNSRKITVAILTISTRAFQSLYEDLTGKQLKKIISKFHFELKYYEILPDNKKIIKKRLKYLSDKLKIDLILTTGGTGFSKNDVTPEATLAVIDKRTDGITLLSQIKGLKKTVYAALSRAISGIRKNTLIINLPGSPSGACESFKAITPVLPHAFEIMK